MLKIIAKFIIKYNLNNTGNYIDVTTNMLNRINNRNAGDTITQICKRADLVVKSYTTESGRRVRR